MKKFIIPVVWSMSTEMVIEADNLKEAFENALESFSEKTPHGNYLEDSFVIQKEILNNYTNNFSVGDKVIVDYHKELCEGEIVEIKESFAKVKIYFKKDLQEYFVYIPLNELDFSFKS